MELPDASSILLTSFKFDDLILSEDETITTSYLMFQHLELISLFHIDPQVHIIVTDIVIRVLKFRHYVVGYYQ